MRPTIILLATMALALLVVGGVATGQQQQESTSSAQAPTTTDKGSGDVTIESTTVKASFTNGTGANFLGIQVSDHGNLLGFESPAGRRVNSSGEGYALCSDATVPSYDWGGGELGFNPPTFAQPNGAGTFPLTVTRNTTDGKFQLKQVWAKPDAIEKDVTVTMTITNRTSSSISNVSLTRTGDFDLGGSINDYAALTDDSAWQFDDRVAGPDSFPDASGLQLTTLTFATPHVADIHSYANWPANRTGCDDSTQITPTGTGDWTMRVIYTLGNLSAGQSKTVKYEYSRM